jgi:putative thioredoxin
MAPAGAKDAELDGVRAALALADQAPSDIAPYEQRLAKDAGDHEARLELAKALAGHGRMDEAVDELFKIIEVDLDWNEGAARAQLLKIFEAAGFGSDTAKRGRRRLSAILFS